MRNTVLKSFLCLSILFSLALLVSDAELCAAAPNHAYALIILTIIDSLILGAVFVNREPLLRIAPFWECLRPFSC